MTSNGPGGVDFYDVELRRHDMHFRAAVLGLRHVRDLLDGLDPAAAEHAADRLHAPLVAHHTDGGVSFDSRAWIVTATAVNPPR